MTRAVDENGELINLLRYSRLELKSFKKRKYYCIKCKKRLILKIGERNRPHFSHFSPIATEERQGESNHHKLATELLYETFNKQGLKTVKEHFISTIKQRPDVAVFLKDKAYAFEFQASNISLTLFRKRTLNLKKAGFKSIWLLSSHFLKMKTNSILRITPFISQFIHRLSHETSPQIFFLNPEKEKVVILEHILLLSGKLAYVQKRVIPLKYFTLDDIKNYSPFNIKQLFSLWKNEKFKFRTEVRSRSYGAEYQWRLWLYRQKIHFEALPSIIHLPTRDNFYFKVPPWNWQSRLYLEVIYPLEINKSFSYNDCLKVLRKYLIPHTHYPLIETHTNPLINYLKLLTHLKIIKPQSNKKYIKIKNPTLNKQLKNSLIADDDIIKQLLYNLN